MQSVNLHARVKIMLAAFDIKIQNIYYINNKNLLEVGMLPSIHITISGYALMVGVGLFCALSLAYNRNDKFKFSIKELLAMIVANLIGVVIGSKFIFFMVGLPEWIKDFSFILMLKKIVGSGFVFYGGLLGAMLGTFVCSGILKLDRRKVFDYFVPIYLTFHACGRIGCLLAGCCYGKECTFGLVMADGVRRFPVQLVEAICILAILFVVLYIEKRKKDVALLRVYLLIYPICRFALEFLRGDEIRGLWGGISTSQWISISILLVNLFGILRKQINKVSGKSS